MATNSNYEKTDETHKEYGSIIRRRLDRQGYTQREVEQELELLGGSISALINGRQFMSADKVNRLLVYLGFNGSAKDALTEAINYQRLHPVVTKPFLNFRLRAMRALLGKKVAEIETPKLSADTIMQIENGLSSVGPKRLKEFEVALGQKVELDLEQIARMEALLDEYSELDILTLAYFLINQYESRNTPKGNQK